MRPSIGVPLALALLATAFGGCGGGGSDDDRPLVVATTGMIGDVARRIGGDAVRVEVLMGPGVDPHLYRATERDVRRLGTASLVLFNGLFLEGKMADVLERVGADRPVLRVTQAIDAAELLEPDGSGGHPDPHVWNDVRLWAKTIDPIRDALAKVVPERAAAFTERATALHAEFTALDAWIERQVKRIPASQRVLVTAHDAFGYLGRRYGLEVRGLQGISTATEAGTRDLQDLAAFIVARKLPAIFVESSVPKKAIRALCVACERYGHTVTIGGELFSDAMGAEGSAEATYPGMIRHNVRTIVAALSGDGDAG